MRQLHPVSFHEHFVASGTYVFYQDDVPTGDVEHWTLHEPGQGAWTVRADHDGRDGTGESWLFEGLYNCERRHFERFDLSLYGTQHTDAKFIFEPGEVQVSLRVDGVAKDRLDLPLPDAYTVRLPALVADGLALADDKPTPAFVPALDFSAGLVTGGTLETPIIEQQGVERVEVAGQMLDARVYRVRGEPSGEFTAWLDAHDIQLCHQSATGLTAVLSQYVHRPETTL